MKDSRRIGGKEHISISRASEITRYSKDYIGQLCRSGKITAELVGRSWFVERSSLLGYKEAIESSRRQYPKHVPSSVNHSIPPPIVWKMGYESHTVAASEIGRSLERTNRRIQQAFAPLDAHMRAMSVILVVVSSFAFVLTASAYPNEMLGTFKHMADGGISGLSLIGSSLPDSASGVIQDEALASGDSTSSDLANAWQSSTAWIGTAVLRFFGIPSAMRPTTGPVSSALPTPTISSPPYDIPKTQIATSSQSSSRRVQTIVKEPEITVINNTDQSFVDRLTALEGQFNAFRNLQTLQNQHVPISSGGGSVAVDLSHISGSAITGSSFSGSTGSFSSDVSVGGGLTVAGPSVFSDAVNLGSLTVSSTTATSTFANGINITGGCFAVNGSCLTGGGGSSGTVNMGTHGQLAYYASSGQVVSGISTSTLGINFSGVVGTAAVSQGGTGATSFGQGWLFSNGGTGALSASTSPTVNYITATSTTATSTIPILRDGEVAVQHIDGSWTYTVATTSSNLGRGTALQTAVSKINNGDSIYLASSTYDLNNHGLDLSRLNTIRVSLHGAGKYSTIILGTLSISPEEDISDLSVISAGTAIDSIEAAYGLVISNVYVSSASGAAIWLSPDVAGTGELDNITCDAKGACIWLENEVTGSDIPVYNIYNSVLRSSGANGGNGGDIGSSDHYGILAQGVSAHIYNTEIDMTNTGGENSYGVQVDQLNDVLGSAYISGGSVKASTYALINVPDGSSFGVNTIGVTANTIYDPTKTSGTITYTDSNQIGASLGQTTVNVGLDIASPRGKFDATSALGAEGEYGGIFGFNSGSLYYGVYGQGDDSGNYAGLGVWDDSTSQLYGVYASSSTMLNYFGGNVGIGTTTPWGLLSVSPNGISGPAFVVGSSTATKFIVANGGNVGVGTTSPFTAFAVNGAGYFSGNLTIGGKLHAAGGVDPPYVLFDQQTPDQAQARVDQEVTPSMQSGLAVFWDGTTLRGLTTRNNQSVFYTIPTSQDDLSALTVSSTTATTASTAQTASSSLSSADMSVVASIASSTAISVASSIAASVASSTFTALASQPSFIQNLANQIMNAIGNAANWVFAKITATLGVFTGVQTQTLETQTASISEGLEMTDHVTGQIYCVMIANGDWSKVPGKCSDVATSTPETGTTTASQATTTSAQPTEGSTTVSTATSSQPTATSTEIIVTSTQAVATSTPPTTVSTSTGTTTETTQSASTTPSSSTGDSTTTLATTTLTTTTQSPPTTPPAPVVDTPDTSSAVSSTSDSSRTTTQ